jgi:ATP-dependent DNA helicase RecG
MLDAIENAMCKYADGGVNGGVNGGVFDGLNETEKEVFGLIKENPHIRAFEMAQKLMKPVRTIENNIRQLKEKGMITRVGSDKKGYWKIN